MILERVVRKVTGSKKGTREGMTLFFYIALCFEWARGGWL